MESNETFNIYNQNKDVQKLLKQLQKVFQDGYRPVRGTESYSTIIDRYTQAYNIINCLGHVFNLTNQQLNDYHIIPYRTFQYFPNINTNTEEQAQNRIINFIKEVGLQVEKCDPNQPIEDFKSWKIALYFENNQRSKDFHFLLQENPQLWSSKLGFTSYLEHIYENTPPKEYRTLVDEKLVYNLYGTYKITNQNADLNNPYVKNAITKSTIPHEIPKKKHCIIQGTLEENFINNFDPILCL